ncbi:MAG TPA: hypothetical protein VFH48_01710 [Chloroflexota bacterium]|nr:hypothetical protein [Chloroflexota bacterium]
MTTETALEKKSKRQNGEGSVFFWPGRGWYAAITGADGRRIMRKAPKQTERGAEVLLRELLAQRRAGEHHLIHPTPSQEHQDSPELSERPALPLDQLQPRCQLSMQAFDGLDMLADSVNVQVFDGLDLSVNHLKLRRQFRV